MPPRDPSKVQLDFPELVADLANTLNLIGQVGLLDFDPEVRPVFIVGSRGFTVSSEEVVYLPAEVIDAEIVNPAAGVHLDTGQLVAGDFDCKIMMSASLTAGAINGFTFEHRNAADAANISQWALEIEPAISNDNINWKFSIRVAANERLRFATSVAATGRIGMTLMFKRRLTP